MQEVYEWLFSRTRAGADRGPARARDLLDRLGHPDRAFSCVRVVGTNGKGSTAAMLSAGLLAAGETVGTFTSPHLQRFEERVRVNGREVSREETRAFVAWAREHAADLPFFELALGFACATFAARGVTTAVVEAGVGGASDATQALDQVAAVLLTNVALDHVATLGPTVRDIARDKAGAARADAPFLTTATGEELDVALEVAEALGAPCFSPRTHPALFDLPRPPRLLGDHQRDNARLALAALRLLDRAEGVDAALDAAHPGRLERFEVAGREVLLDGAHNPHAAAAIARTLGQVHTLVFGAMGRKAVPELLAPLKGIARRVIFTSPGELGADPLELAASFGGEARSDPAEALELALRETPRGGRVLVAGSLYLVGALRGTMRGARATQASEAAPGQRS